MGDHTHPQIISRRTVAVLALASGLALVGCSPPNKPAPTDPSATVATVDPMEDQVDPADDPTDTTEQEPTEVRVGDTFTWTDGLKAAVVRVRRYPISEVGSGGNPKTQENLLLTVKLVAATATSAELSITSTLQYGADGRTAEAVFDSADYGGGEGNAFQEAPSRLRKGRSLTDSFGFAVPKGRTVPFVFTLQPGYDYVDATFTGRG